MGRRHKVDIAADIIAVAMNGVKKTNIVYLTNLNFTIFGQYLKLLSEKGFVEVDNGLVYTTDRGINFLVKYKDLMSFWGGAKNDLPQSPNGFVFSHSFKREADV
jgi:predicted transcriptional regulator